MCKLHGRDAAAIGSQPSEDVPPDWNTHVRVDSVDDVAAKTIEAGGHVALGPFGSPDGGGAGKERGIEMLLEDKNAVIYGAGEAIGGVVSREATRPSLPVAP